MTRAFVGVVYRDPISAVFLRCAHHADDSRPPKHAHSPAKLPSLFMETLGGNDASTNSFDSGLRWEGQLIMLMGLSKISFFLCCWK